jgi:hypothetical protein
MFNSTNTLVITKPAIGISVETELQKIVRFFDELTIWGKPHPLHVGERPYCCYVSAASSGRPKWHGDVYESYAPTTARHWYLAMLHYCQERHDLTAPGTRFNARILRRGDVHEWPDSPTVAPLLLDFLSEHPQRTRQWEWFLAHVNKNTLGTPVEVAPGVWAE